MRRIDHKVLEHELHHLLGCTAAGLMLLTSERSRDKLWATEVHGSRPQDHRLAQIKFLWPEDSLFVPKASEVDFVGSISLAPAICDASLETRQEHLRSCNTATLLTHPQFGDDIRQAHAFEPSPTFAVQVAERVETILKVLGRTEAQWIRYSLKHLLSLGQTKKLSDILPAGRVTAILDEPDRSLLQARGYSYA